MEDTIAHSIADLNSDLDDDEFVGQLETTNDTEKMHDPNTDSTRYEFMDGSAIISNPGGWDIGVHDSRIETVQKLADDLWEASRSVDSMMGEDGSHPVSTWQDARFMWVNAEQAAQPEDAYPAS